LLDEATVLVASSRAALNSPSYWSSLAASRWRGAFDLIVVDEAQDFSTVIPGEGSDAFSFVEELAKPAGRVILLGDSKQMVRLNAQGGTWSPPPRYREHPEWRVNRRNTREIIEFLITHEWEYARNTRVALSGINVAVDRFTDPQQIWKTVASLTKQEVLRQPLTPGDIAVVACHPSLIPWIERARPMSLEGYPVLDVDAIKGLEAKVVVLVLALASRASDGSLRRTGLDQEALRSLMYVGSTRAQGALYLMVDEGSSHLLSLRS
jgi:hypothetical protein